MAKKNPPLGGNKKEKEENLVADRLKDIQIVDELQESYIDYAMSVIVSRAIPDIRDGLKPVQRRILWAMWDMGLKSTSKFIKSARVVGEVLGKYHPHGDSAVYDAMVRMAQDFSLRYPLVNGQGNFGCFTGDTKIKLADGRSLSFRELIKEDRKGKKNYAFTFNHEIGEIEIAEVKKPRKTGNSAELVKIALDNGRELKCTPDHKFMLRNGKYGEAQDLKPGDSLMPGYTRSSDKNDNPETVGYLMIQEPRSGEWNFIHHLADKWNLKNGKYEKSAGRVRHHRDFNKENNNPDNVIRMGWKEHWKLHSELAAWRHENDPEYVRKLAEGRRKYIDNNREIFSERARKLNKKLWKSEKFRGKIISQVKKMWQDPEYKKRMSRLSSKQLKEKWQEEGFQKLMSKIKSAEMKKRWQDPEYRKEQTKRMKEMSDELWSNEKHREYMSELMKEKARDPEWRAKQSKISKKLWQKPEYRSKYPEDHFSKMAKKLWMDESVRTFHSERAKEQWKNPGFRRKAISAARKGNKKYLKEHPNHMKEMAEIAARSLKSNWQNSAYKKQIVGSKILRHVHNLLEEHGNVTPSLYERFRIQNGTPTLKNALGYFNNFEEIVEKAKTYNHTVKSVEFVKEKRDVYDITIDNTHNFLLDAGIFVHNSVDSDPPAAQRYTEAKLSKISEELLVDIEKDTVDWESNYDGTREEPKYLPAKLPELLLNGTMGIAVGMATSIPPHNLGEVIDAIVHLVANPDATVKDLMKYLPGPDFPTGGLIYDAEELREAYSTGRGSVTIQAATDVEERQKHMTLVINEIPFQVNKSSLIEKIASLVQEKKIEGIKDVRDESGREGIRMAVDLKQGVAPERVLNQLFKNTELQKKFYFNMVALVDGLQPRTVSLKDILSAYVEHRKITITRKIKYDLKKAEERAHVLEGLVIALDDINKVIATIKKSKDRDDAHKNLVSKFKLTPVQADAILDMRLQSLASLEARKIKDELKEKKKLIKELKAILKSKKKILDIIVDELEVMKKEYGDDRRTKIVKKELKEFKDEDFIAEKETVIFLTNDGYIKRIPPTSFKTQGRGGRGLHGFDLKEKDKVSELVIASTHDDILFFTDSGKVFKTKVYKIPASSRTAKGKLIHTFLGLSDNEKVATFLTYNEKDKDMRSKFLCFGTERGIVKKTAVPEFDNVQSTGIIAINLKSDDTLRWVKTSTGSDHFVFATREGRLIRFSEKEVRPMGRGASGVGAIRIRKEDGVTGFVIIRGNESEKDKKFLVITENGYGKQTPIGKYKTQKRGGRGITTVKVTKKTGPLSAIRLVDKEIEEVIAFSAKGLIIKTKLKDIRTAGRATQGVRIMRLDKDDTVVGVVCL